MMMIKSFKCNAELIISIKNGFYSFPSLSLLSSTFSINNDAVFIDKHPVADILIDDFKLLDGFFVYRFNLKFWLTMLSNEKVCQQIIV